jgi:hypothetical protein
MAISTTQSSQLESVQGGLDPNKISFAFFPFFFFLYFPSTKRVFPFFGFFWCFPCPEMGAGWGGGAQQRARQENEINTARRSNALLTCRLAVF